MSVTRKFYRNIQDITSIEGITVDADSLWKSRNEGTLLVLVDDDQHVTALRNQNFRKETEN